MGALPEAFGLLHRHPFRHPPHPVPPRPQLELAGDRLTGEPVHQGARGLGAGIDRLDRAVPRTRDPSLHHAEEVLEAVFVDEPAEIGGQLCWVPVRQAPDADARRHRHGAKDRPDNHRALPQAGQDGLEEVGQHRPRAGEDLTGAGDDIEACHMVDGRAEAEARPCQTADRQHPANGQLEVVRKDWWQTASTKGGGRDGTPAGAGIGHHLVGPDRLNPVETAEVEDHAAVHQRLPEAGVPLAPGCDAKILAAGEVDEAAAVVGGRGLEDSDSAAVHETAEVPARPPDRVRIHVQRALEAGPRPRRVDLRGDRLVSPGGTLPRGSHGPHASASARPASGKVTSGRRLKGHILILPVTGTSLDADGWTPAAWPSTLPVVLSSFVGREDEMMELAAALDGHRLVSVTGTAGVGKTRLAVEVARRVKVRFPGGAWFVDLSTADRPDDVVRVVTAGVSARDLPQRDAISSLAAQLRPDRRLLILDNCEHVLSACVRLVQALLDTCSRLCVLCTTREPLGIPGEFVRRLDGLSVVGGTDDGDPPPHDDAVQLFLDRMVDAGAPTADLVDSAITEICNRLDGVPLAIELAAAWVGCLAPTEISERLDHSLVLLTRGIRTGPARHRTLRAALEWSFDLLSPAERAFLARLAVFAGGWTVAAAESVCSGIPLDDGQTLTLLAGLAEKSMVVRESLPEGASRFRLLETIREYAHEKLCASGEERTVRERHLAWCLELTAEVERGLQGPAQITWLRRVDMELANIASAGQWALSEGRSETALRLASNLTLFWLIRGRMREGLERLGACLAPDTDVASRAQGVWGSGLLAWMVGDLDRAWAAGQDSLALFRSQDDIAGMGRSLGLLGMVETVRNPVDARAPLDESVRLAREAGDQWCLACSLGMLGYAAVFQGELAAAAIPFEQAVAVARSAGDLQGLRMSMLGAGWVALQRGSTDSAARSLEEGLAIARSLGDPVWTAVALVYTGELARARGDSRGARVHFEEATALARDAGASVILAFSLSFLGRSLLDDGRLLEAGMVFEEVVEMAPLAGNQGNVALSLLGAAEVAQATGDVQRADERYHQALQLARRWGDRLAEARVLLGLGRFARTRGDLAEAAALTHEALDTDMAIGGLRGVMDALETLGGLAVDGDHPDQAARLLGAADGLRRAAGFARLPSGHGDLAPLAGHLGEDRLQRLLDEGGALSPEEAVDYARRARGSRRHSRTGWDSLSRTEVRVVELAATGLTNREIGERLFVSPRTVQTHLAHAYAKLGVASRRELGSMIACRRDT